MASYTVKSGDTLSKIAQQIGYGGDYARLAKENNIANPNVIRTGQIINYGSGGAPAPTATPTAVPQQSFNPSPQPSYSGSGITPEGISIAQLPPDLVYQGQLDVSNPVKLAKYQQIVGQSGRSNSSTTSSFSMPSRPTIDLQSIYNSALTDTGVTNLQAQSDAVQKQIDSRRTALATATATINDNPFYSEATRVGKIAKLNDAANQDISNFVNQQTVAQNKVSQAKADAQVKLNIASQQYNIQSQDYQNQLQQFNNLLTSGALNNISANDVAQIAQATGMTTSMINSIVSTSRQKNEVKPQLVTIDDGQHQKIVAIDPNGNVINTQILGPTTKATSGGGGGGSSSTTAKQVATQAKADQQMQAKFESAISDGIKQLQSGSQWGEVWQRIHLLFPDAPPELIDSLLGTSWRQPGAYQAYQANKKGQ